MNIAAIIPARFASTRFPGKPLVDIGGKPMIQRVYEQVQKASGISAIVVATDDERIAKTVKDFGGNVVITAEHHPSGTDRCAEVLQQLRGTDAVINIQGDEPFIHPEQVEQLVSLLAQPETQIGTLCRRITDPADIFDPSKVKIVFDKHKKALYFSRSAMPFNRNVEQHEWINHTAYFLHVGIYGYKTKVLQEITNLPLSSLETSESLEQLRWLENGYTIHADITIHESFGIDTPGDLSKITHLL